MDSVGIAITSLSTEAMSSEDDGMQNVRNYDEVWTTPLLHNYTTGVKHRTGAQDAG